VFQAQKGPLADRQGLRSGQSRRSLEEGAQRNAGGRTAQPSLLAGLLFDGDGNRMTPSHAVKKGTRYRYYVSRPLITKDRPDRFAGRRIPAAEIEQACESGGQQRAQLYHRGHGLAALPGLRALRRRQDHPPDARPEPTPQLANTISFRSPLIEAGARAFDNRFPLAGLRDCSPYSPTIAAAGFSRMPTPPRSSTKAHSAAIRRSEPFSGRRVRRHMDAPLGH
jgi:hypothetical protein